MSPYKELLLKTPTKNRKDGKSVENVIEELAKITSLKPRSIFNDKKKACKSIAALLSTTGYLNTLSGYKIRNKHEKEKEKISMHNF